MTPQETKPGSGAELPESEPNDCRACNQNMCGLCGREFRFLTAIEANRVEAPAEPIEAVIDILCRMNEAPATHIRTSWKSEIQRAIVALRAGATPSTQVPRSMNDMASERCCHRWPHYGPCMLHDAIVTTFQAIATPASPPAPEPGFVSAADFLAMRQLVINGGAEIAKLRNSAQALAEQIMALPLPEPRWEKTQGGCPAAWTAEQFNEFKRAAAALVSAPKGEGS
jgi:hypothetical protein